MSKKQKKVLGRIVASAVMVIAIAVIPMPNILNIFLSLFCYLIIGYDILIKAFRGIIGGRIWSENFLMAVATIGAIVLAFYSGSGDFFEAIAVMLFYQIGELFQSIAVGKSRRSIAALMDIRPDYANVEVDGAITVVHPDEVKIGDIIVVKTGEKVPIDGIVTEGRAELNTSALTGESMPREASVGDHILSGCINTNGLLKIRTTKEFGESTVSKILELMEESSSRKSRSENFIAKFARFYTPAVCLAALCLAVIPSMLGLIINGQHNFAEWIYRALTFLVISCPCALVISIPLTFFAGIGGIGRAGILVKGSNYIEALSKVKTVVFDKTGTLTEGVFSVSHVKATITDEDKLIEYAAYAESASSHPISRSLRRAYGKDIIMERVCDIEEISGHGVITMVDGHKIAVGNGKLMESVGAAYEAQSGATVHVAIDGQYGGYVTISDRVKESSKTAISMLKKIGVGKTVMLTGDAKAVADNVGREIGMDEIYSELLPEDKVKKIEELISHQNPRFKLAFVGDGINDAPVISRADIGIAMGGIGSDAAIEAADVVLMDDEPMKVAKAIKASKKCMTIVYQNILFALGVKVACLILGALGIANMWLAIFADVGVMVLAVLNAIRALRIGKQ